MWYNVFLYQILFLYLYNLIKQTIMNKLEIIIDRVLFVENKFTKYFGITLTIVGVLYFTAQVVMSIITKS